MAVTLHYFSHDKLDLQYFILLALIYRGFIALQDQMYLIEPLPGETTGQQDGAHSDDDLHAVYNYKHLRRKRSSCSHGNTTTFYDHGAHPSGLFQLGSLVRTPHGHIHRLCGFTQLIIHGTDSFRHCATFKRIKKILQVTFNKTHADKIIWNQKIILHFTKITEIWQKKNKTYGFFCICTKSLLFH